MDAAIDVHGLTKSFRRHSVLANLGLAGAVGAEETDGSADFHPQIACRTRSVQQAKPRILRLCFPNGCSKTPLQGIARTPHQAAGDRLRARTFLRCRWTHDGCDGTK